MPITPFHFGPGAALKGVLGPQMSFTVFAFANVLIDVALVTLWRRRVQRGLDTRKARAIVQNVPPASP